MYKRNQLEDAIARALQGSTSLSSQMRSRVKRLLEIDRACGRNKRSNDPEQANFAFHGAATPGRGNENFFSDYETFALSTGLRLMGLGWPQGVVVALLRRVRPELEQHHRRIL